ncbi:hypothetical protein K1T71_003868 [Dendrolimus kikuchii]|uniref:Uncharacterized protein n=1 Tax=Dendrolimus kikuchii TaxID=765133 RepID=A0ACC1D965_9NEOP|nr:hypothetical protein K1T71_003868 [Dendrolimus kikuchii]
MTISGNMKENKQRSVKDTWESELGYAWSRSGQQRCVRHRAPESTMSVSSDIRFTRRKLSRPCRGCCAALAVLLVLLLLAAVAVYLAHLYLLGDPLNRQTFRGSFVVSSWKAEENDLNTGPWNENRTRENELQRKLASIYQNSELRSCFVSADILALDNVEDGMRVHFEVSFEPIFTAVNTAEVTTVLTRELEAPVYFTHLNTLRETLHIEESSAISSLQLKEPETTSVEPSTTEETGTDSEEEIRECSPMTLSLCSHLPYNVTSYPNLVGHSSKDALLRDLVAFRELLDAECSHLAQDFVCQMLQPRCVDDRVVRPCRAYCRTFHAGCGARLPERLRPHFDCARFPDYFGLSSCAPEPGCAAGLQRLALSQRACDGIPDCADAEDERSCAHCVNVKESGVRCALDARCLPVHLRCDGTPDCPDGSDETGCLWITRSLSSWRRENSETTLGAIRSRSGYAVWTERGRNGKICATPYENDKKALTSVATSLCRQLTFKAAITAEVVPDSEESNETDDQPTLIKKENPQYVEIVDPFAAEISFVKSECPHRKVIKVVCDQLECGVASARGDKASDGVEGLSRTARPGDWPWHAALLRSYVHACDAALIHSSWLITTASCFQGQPKAEWTARFGTVRIQSTTPWQQERRIVGMVRSPVEGSMLALVRLEEPVEMTDFVRPICLPDSDVSNGKGSTCNTLGWTRNRDQLQRVHLITSSMNTCENVSIVTVNGICAEPLYDQDDCNEEEYAGSFMMCLDERSKRWSLVGVSGWRIACTKIGLGRPRIYDSITSHVDWIRRTISNAARYSTCTVELARSENTNGSRLQASALSERARALLPNDHSAYECSCSDQLNTMEVADQWQREWAGTAEYGKVTEGGITRRVARAMEVLHASGPGARVRVMRAAYHSTAGPGIPASSYTLHSSRRILSSGFNLEEPPSLPSRPLEISSLPLESSLDSQTETEKYKVTEPDDIDISEPSKWRGSTKANGIRMPSEESSSTDNASIIDLDSRSSSRNLNRKYSYDSENSDIHWNKRNASRISPLLDAPVTLSTLKYKSLLNNSSEWTTRRKSYSFEDTSPINETPFYNEILAMESSTDSGICKSSEIVNDQVDENMNSKYIQNRDKNTLRDESFQDWLSKNKINSFYKGTKFKSHREHEVVMEDPVENSISLQATGKVSITLPITVEKGYEGPQNRKTQSNDEGHRKIKKVEFCKTELHFAAESGKVNIIATDEKPPPSNDFRKRRSVFLPIQNMSDKPITLFGDKTKEYPELNHPDEIFTSESGESDENTAATKSILKNKIPKPKPYLLGENMVFGLKDGLKSKDHSSDFSVTTAVSLINKQLEADKRHNEDKISIYPREIHTRLSDNHALRTINKGPNRKEDVETGKSEKLYSNDLDITSTTDISKMNSQGSPVKNRLKTRELRMSDLTYFGVDKTSNSVTPERVIKNRLSTVNANEDDVFRSVRLIQQISHSVSNSEPESEDMPEYQNFPLNTSYAPIPTPRHSLKFDDQLNEIEEINISKPTIIRERNIINDSEKRIFRRTKSREQYETITSMSRSRSEPRKSYHHSPSKSRGQETKSTRYREVGKKEAEEGDKKDISTNSSDAIEIQKMSNAAVPLYANLNSDTEIKDEKSIKRKISTKLHDRQKKHVNLKKNESKENDLKPNLPINNSNTIEKSPAKLPIRYGKENGNISFKNINNSHKRDCSAQIDKRDENNLNIKSRKGEVLLPQRDKSPKKEFTQQPTTENNNKTLTKYRHRSRSSHRITGSNETNKHDIKARDDSSDKSNIKEAKETDTYRKTVKSPEKKGSTKEPMPNKNRKSDTESPVRRLPSSQSKPTDRNIINKSSNTKKVNSFTPNRKEYIINYDDKNGTMSSVCKVKSGSHSSRRKIPIDMEKDNTKENKFYLRK